MGKLVFLLLSFVWFSYQVQLTRFNRTLVHTTSYTTHTMISTCTLVVAARRVQHAAVAEGCDGVISKIVTSPFKQNINVVARMSIYRGENS